MRLSMKWIRLGLSLLGVAGVGVTSFASIKCYEKAKTKTTKKEKIICSLPAIGSGLATAGCIMGAYGAGSKEIATLMAGCGYLASKSESIEKIVRKKLGPEELKEVKKQAAIETHRKLDSTNGVCYERTGKGEQKFLFWEQGRYFLSSMPAVLEADRKINYDMSRGLIPTWNDYYDYLDIHNTHVGQQYIIPIDGHIGEWNTDRPIDFDYMDWTDEITGEDITLITVNSSLTPLMEEF